MAEVKDIKDIGYSGAIKYLLAEHLHKVLNIPVVVEPQPVSYAEPHLRLMFTGFDFEATSDITVYHTEKLYTVRIDCLVTLTAYGDGPDVFLDSVVRASFALRRLFDRAFSIQTVDGYGITVVAKKKERGQIFKNEEEGKKPYLYEENYDLSIYLPYVEVLNG